MPLYNETELEAANTFYEITRAINNLSNGLLMGVILVVLSLVLLITFSKRENLKVAMLGTSFVVAIVSIGLWGLQLIGENVVLFPVLFLMFSIFLNAWKGG